MYGKIQAVVQSRNFTNFITYLIILNGITMGLETSREFMANFGGLASLFNTLVISIFTIEIAMRIYVHRLSFFKDPWSIFDFTIVAISLIPVSEGFEILRVLRVLRLFRLVTVVPQMRKIVSALISVIPGMLSIAALMSLFFYIFAIMATQLYSEKFPEWFGTLGESFYTLFQIMTLESWSMGIVRPIMEVYPFAWMFFVPFIFIVTFVMINLIVAIVVDAMSIINKSEEEHIVEEVQVAENHTNNELIKLRDEIRELKTLIKASVKS
ncbi:ion transporter [Sulfurimonas sp.]|jgi:voltage-gated sodium channel|uniref:ion transporter n=1 Tax=Sulfurimonas sp. TaxID=2022749 RepID=UPI0025EFD69A|nr:ion transporter [Sulfurimonas sp.]MCK9473071.1 ion transporter [Sulfurimonas sp.]